MTMSSWEVDLYVPHTQTCICRRCHARRRKLEREALKVPQCRVWSDEVAAHIERLLGAGMRRVEIARAAGLSPAVITKASKCGNTIDGQTAQKILELEAVS